MNSTLIQALKKVVAKHTLANINEILDAVNDGGWEYVEDESLEDYLREFGDTGYFFENPEMLENVWLIHFTNSDPTLIKKSKFKGLDVKWLGLTKDVGVKSGNYALAYLVGDLTMSSIRQNVYGSKSIIFKVKKAVRAYHNADGEYQVIFDVNDVDYASSIVCHNFDETINAMADLV